MYSNFIMWWIPVLFLISHPQVTTWADIQHVSTEKYNKNEIPSSDNTLEPRFNIQSLNLSHDSC